MIDKPSYNLIPEGYRKDSRGALVPESMIKPIDLTRDALVLDLTEKAKKMNAALYEFKKGVFEEIEAFLALSLEQYNVKLGGKKGNLTLYSYDGVYKIVLAISERLTFDERLQAAKALVDECISEWSVSSRDEIKVLISAAFQTDKEGKINTGRVLELRRLNIEDEKWQMAMKAISDSLQVVGSKEYVRFYKRVPGSLDAYEPIVLDLAAV